MPWSTSAPAGDTTTDYAAQNLAGIAKVMAVNPDMGAKMLSKYQEREASSDGFLAGMWDAVTSPVRGLIGALGNITSSFAEPFRDEEEGEEDNFLVDMWQGISGQENTTWRENLLSYGMEDSWGTTALGLMGDIFLDPTTYLGAGALGKAGSITAKGAQEIAEHGAKKTIMSELASKGGLEVGGHFISKGEDFTTAVAGLSREALTKAGVSDEVIEGMAGITAANAERTVMGSVEQLAQKSYQSIGRIVGDAVIQRKSIHALPETVVDDIGRQWSKKELIGIFENTRKLGTDDLVKLGNEIYGKGAISKTAAQQLGRTAAAAQGGVRLKFGIPFGERMAKAMDTPWLGYRWQSGALPYANRLKMGKGGIRVGGKLITEDVAFTKMGDFFRGVSGINRLDNAIHNSIVAGGVWDKSHMNILMRDGFSGLRTRMMNGTLEEKAAFNELFGNKVVSSFIPMSERAGEITAAFTSGAQAWRRDGIIGLRSVEHIRTAKASKRVFRAYAARHEESWSRASQQLEMDAKAGKVDKLAVNDRIVEYLEGITEDLDIVPHYLHGPAKEMRDLYPKLLEKARQMGADVGDVTEVAARRRAEQAIKLLNKEKKALQKQMDALNEAAAKKGVKATDQQAGVSAADDMAKQELWAKLVMAEKRAEKIEKELAENASVVERMAEYDALVGKLTGRAVEKASPTMYFHRRMTKEAREAWIGSGKSGTKTFNKAKKVTAEMERELAGLSFREAEEVLRRKSPALKNVEKIWEDNPFLVYAHYVEDMADVVYKAKLGATANHLMSAVGAVDNGSMVDLALKVRNNMPNTIADMERKAEGLVGQGREIITDWLDSVTVAMGAKVPNGKKIPDRILQDFGIEVLKDVPGAWKTGDWADIAELVPIKTLKKLREYDRGAKPLSAAEMRKTEQEIIERGLDNPLMLGVDKQGRVMIEEGNHRLAILEKLGYNAIPARVSVRKSTDVWTESATKGSLAAEEGVAKKFLQAHKDNPYLPNDIRPSDILESRYLKGEVPKIPEQGLRKLQDLAAELNRLKTRTNDMVAKPEVAIKKAIDAHDDRYWGKVDVPGLEDVVMHPYIAAEFNKAWHGSASRLPGAVGNIQQTYRSWVTGPWKKWATIYWPGFHARNAMGAWFNNWLGGVNNTHYKGAHKLQDVLKKGDKSEYAEKIVAELPKGIKIDGLEGAVTYGRLADHMRDMGVYSANSLALSDMRLLSSGTEEITFGMKSNRVSKRIKIPGSKLKETRYGPVTGAEKFMKDWERLGVNSTNAIENWMRGAAFLKGLDDAAGDSAAARAFTMMRHGDYDELTDAEFVMKDLVPFYKWMRTNVPFQIRNLIENPGKPLAVMDSMNAAVDPELRKKMPDWMKENFAIQLPKGIAGDKDAPGILSLQLPLSDVLMSSNEFFSSFLPVTRQLILENQVFEKNMFTGAPLEGTKFEKVASWVEMTGLGHVADVLGMAQRDVDGNLMMSDKAINAMQIFPIFARSRNWLYDEPERTRLRINAVTSAVAGIGVRPLGDKELNDAEADYYYTNVEPLVTELRAMGYKLPTVDDLAGATGESW